MIAARLFNTPFAGDLFSIAEDPTSGFRITHVRMQIFLTDLDRKIEESNKRTLKELKNEEAAVAASMMSQPDIDAQLNHFSNILYKGLVVSIYSYIESKMSKIEGLCLKNECWSTSFKANNNPFFTENKLFISITKITNNVLTESVRKGTGSASLQELSEWVHLRNDIVHTNGHAWNLTPEFLRRNGITITGEEIILSELSVNNFNDLVLTVLTDIVERISTKHNLVKTISIQPKFKNKEKKIGSHH
jgi:hypothetical protein